MLTLAFSQQDVPFSSLRSLGGYYNPSFTLVGGTHFDLLSRSTWIGSNGSYQTHVSNFSLEFDEKQLVFGLNTTYSSFRIQQEVGAQIYGNYALHLTQGDLRFGLGIGINNLRPDISGLNIKDLEDPYLSSTGMLFPDFSAGITYSNAGTVLTLGAKHMNQPVISRIGTDAIKKVEISASVFHTLSLNEQWRITPMLNMRYTHSKLLGDVIGYFEYKESVWFGPLMRSNGGGGIISGINLNEFVNLAYDVSIGMAYDYTLHNNQFGAHGGNIEFILKLKPLILPDPEEIRKHKRVISPMFL